MSEFYHRMIWQTTCATAYMSTWSGIHVQCCARQGDDSACPVRRESVSPCSVIPNRAVSPVLLSIWVSLAKFCDSLFLSSCTLLSFLFFDALFYFVCHAEIFFGWIQPHLKVHHYHLIRISSFLLSLSLLQWGKKETTWFLEGCAVVYMVN